MRERDRVKDGGGEGTKGGERKEKDLVGLKRRRDGGAGTRKEGENGL